MKHGLSWLAVLLLLTGPGRAESPPRQFILVNRAPSVTWRQDRPESFRRADFEELRQALPTPAEARIRVGAAFIFSCFRTPSPDKLTASLDRFLSLAAATDTPVLVQLDVEQWWNARPDLWNWWDPDRPGYSPANRFNVEWSGWPPDRALKLAWRNWGRQIRVCPPPNLMSPAYRRACHAELARLIPRVLRWWRELPADRRDLLVGIKLGWESSIGVNAWYYPDGNCLLPQPPSADPTTGLDVDRVPDRGVALIGYAAVKTAGLRATGRPTEADLAEVVRRHLRDLCQTAARLGTPRDRLFTHVGGWRDDERLYAAAVNEFSCPGWSFYRHAGDPRQNPGVRAALRHSDAPYWGAVEWLFQGPSTVAAWRRALENTLSNPRCRLVTIFNWNHIRRREAALRAIREVVAASVPAAEPARIGKNAD